MAWTTGREWTGYDLDRMKVWRADGKTAEWIGSQFGVSRSAILGLFHRNGVAAPTRVPKHQRRERKRPTYLPVPKATPRLRGVPQLPVQPKMIPFLKLKDGLCKYPYGDSPPYRFCGCKSVKGLSWCVEHLRIVSVTAKAFEGHPQAAGVRKSASR